MERQGEELQRDVKAIVPEFCKGPLLRMVAPAIRAELIGGKAAIVKPIGRHERVRWHGRDQRRSRKPDQSAKGAFGCDDAPLVICQKNASWWCAAKLT